MKSLFILAITLSISLLCMACTSVTSLIESEAKEKSEFMQTYDLIGTGTISLKNVNGSVNIRVSDEPKVQLKAVKTGPSQEKLEAVKIEVNSQPDRLSIETVYPKGTLNTNVSVSYELSVPKTVNLDSLETVNGSIEISGVQGKIEAETTNGSINIGGGNSGIDAHTVNGSIKVDLKQLASNERIKMESVNGSLTLLLPDSLNAEIEAETTNGKVSNDFTFADQEFNEKKHLKGRIGSGGSQLSLETVNGSISITKVKP
jgi:DUF4097 and DUF4098 domain-containing protein YvlB